MNHQPTDHTALPELETDPAAGQAPAESPADPREKHGSLFGGALTEEVLDSSRRVLSKARGNKNAAS